ncbi:hypothetical protein H6P81_010320 [Aristolochia fimbriata]|uniref:CCHC-type domain-containing protein n=1 Tax=Aristolochia fimbriata TaxID=158543 RepID=A0AAV7EQJ2_ARIFI|nr:hypothetical protein H6P81_010320 [Aristolochia fimbriata]
MAEKSSKTGKIEKFDGSNYQLWRMQIEDHLYEKQLHLPLIGVKPAEMKADEWALLDRRALAVVRMSLTQSVAFNVSKEKTVKDLLTALAGVYEKSSASNRLFLLRKLVYLRMSEGTPIADHLNDFNKLWSQIEAVDLKFDDDVNALMFMCSFPESWDTVITSISNATKEKLKFDEVLSAILNQEMMKRSMVSNTSSISDTALSVDKGKGRDRGRNQSRGPNTRDRSKSKGKSKGKFKCWVCDKEGHVKRDCPERVKNTANVVDGHEEKLCLSVYDEYKVENWYIDSGASFHCTSHKEWFCDYIKGEFGHVIVGNGQKCKIEGRGIIHLKMNDGGKLILKEVRHIPDLQKNLISVNKLDQEGHKITFENSSWKVSRGALTLIKGKAVGTLYPLCTNVDQIVSLAAEKDDKASLWHRRLGHLSENGMRIQHSKKVLTGITNICFDFCEDCVLGKEKRVSFNKDGREKKSNRLDLVHTDVWGPAQGDKYGYRLWDFDNNKVFRSRNVVFNEEQMYKDRKEEKKIEPKEKEYIKRDQTDENLPQATNEQVVPSEGEQQIETEQEDESQGEQSSVDDGESHEYSNAQTDFDDSEIPQEEIVTSGLRRSTRVTKPIQKLNLIVQHVLYTDAGEPESYDEAMADEAHLKWELDMKDKMLSLEENQTWELVKMPAKKKVLQNKWIFRVKQEAGGVQRYKARLVVKGFGQREGIYFHDIFAPVVKMTSIRTILSIVAVKGLYLEQLDVKTAFLHGDLEEEIYMRQPAGFEVIGKQSWVCKLKRSLYGLKQAPRQWYLKFDRFMLDIGFARSNADHCVYLQRFNDGDYIILTLYVDDMLVAGTNMKKIDDLKKKLANQFSMKDLGEAKQLLGIQITRDKKKKKLWLSQEGYVKKVLERFNMHESKAVTTTLGSQFKLSKEQGAKSNEEIAHMKTVPYASAIGSLMYAMVSTRPDIAHAVGVVSRFMKNPGEEHWEAVKWIFRYLKGTSDYCLCFGGNNIDVKGFVDSDHAGDRDNGRSTSGLYSNSQSAIHLAKNSAFHSRTKHILLRYHFIRSLLEKGQLKLEKIDGKKNPADMLTKPVEGQKLSLCSTMVNLH